MNLYARLQALESRLNEGGGGTGPALLTREELKAHFEETLGYVPNDDQMQRLVTSPPDVLTTEELRAIAKIRIGDD